MNWQIARNATRNLLITLAVIGFVGVISFVVNSKLITMIPAILGICVLWFLLYRIEIAYRENRLKGWRA